MLAKLTKKQLLLFGLIIVLLIAIPIALFVIQRQSTTTTQSGAAKSTIVSFDSSSSNNQVTFTKAPGDEVTLPIYVDPGSGASANTISVVTLLIKFDPNYLSVSDPTTCIDTQGFALPTVTSQATCTDGTAIVRLAANSISNFITTKKQVAAITFTVNSDAPVGQTTVSFDESTTQAGSSATKDPESNVIEANGYLPAIINVSTSISITPTISPTPTPTGTTNPGTSPTPNQLPTCSNLTADATSGNPPLTVNFSATSADQFGTVQKATFNFGDGNTQDVSLIAATDTPTPTPTTDPNATPTPTCDPSADPSCGSTDTSTPTQAQTTINPATASHTYSNAGTFKASVTFTDDNGAVSLPGSCIQTISVSNPTTPPSQIAAATATPTIAQTGPGADILGVGAIGVVLSIIGGLLFFAL